VAAVIVAAGGDHSGLAAKSATAIIPIVFGIGGDPVKAGLVSSFSRPGGNVTGVTLLTSLMARLVRSANGSSLPKLATTMHWRLRLDR
jgi:putative tryptophan/tyrosine transport system substrate-binding protein